MQSKKITKVEKEKIEKMVKHLLFPKINYLEIVYEDIFNRKCTTRVWVQKERYKFVPPK